VFLTPSCKLFFQSAKIVGGMLELVIFHTASDEGKESMGNLVSQLLELHLKWV
jgi:hypothetical protein